MSDRAIHGKRRPRCLLTFLCPHCQQESGGTDIDTPRCFACGNSKGLIEVKRETLTPEALARRMTASINGMMEHLRKAWECERGEPRGDGEETMLLQALAKGSDLQRGIQKMAGEMVEHGRTARRKKMKKQIPQIPKPLEEYLAAVEGDARTFTQLLRAFEKQHGLYCTLPLPDAESIFTHCERVFRSAKSTVVRYNTLRFAKFAVTTPDFVRGNAQRIWALYCHALADPDGNVRHAGTILLERYLFGTILVLEPYPQPRRKSKRNREAHHQLELLLLEQLRDLLKREAMYLASHLDIVEEEKFSHTHHRWLCSWETHDKHLKTIRRGIEEFCRGTWIPDLLKKHSDERTLRMLHERSLIW